MFHDSSIGNYKKKLNPSRFSLEQQEDYSFIQSPLFLLGDKKIGKSENFGNILLHFLENIYKRQLGQRGAAKMKDPSHLLFNYSLDEKEIIYRIQILTLGIPRNIISDYKKFIIEEMSMKSFEIHSSDNFLFLYFNNGLKNKIKISRLAELITWMAQHYEE